MFQIALVTIITLRVILCPLLCGGEAEHAQAGEIQPATACACSDPASQPCRGDAQPTDAQPADSSSDCPGDRMCHCSCFCQAPPVSSDRMTSVDLSDSLDLPQLDSAASTTGVAHAPVERDVVAHRRDTPSGRQVRLAHASLLL
jgi:hypothetical protein